MSCYENADLIDNKCICQYYYYFNGVYCQKCLDENRKKCESVNFRSCVMCENTFITDKGQYLNCSELNQTDSCLDFHQICTSSETSELCEKCNINNYNLSECMYESGFFNMNGICKRKLLVLT